MQQTMKIRGREYTLFETYSRVEIAQRVAALLRQNGDALAHVATKRGENAVYVYRLYLTLEQV